MADDLSENFGRSLGCDDDCLPIPRVAHAPPPALCGVARLRVEAATPGRARSYAQRMGLMERAGKAVDT